MRDPLLFPTVRFASDSLVEGSGFEPSVPLERGECRKGRACSGYLVREGLTPKIMEGPGQTPQISHGVAGTVWWTSAIEILGVQGGSKSPLVTD
jgi:hypothetical protein